MRKTLTFSLAAATTLLGAGVAWAQADSRPAGPPSVTRAQVEQRAAERFGRMDANDDGVLNQADREAHQAARQAAVFDRIDADGDGAISRAEFTAQRGERREARDGRGERGPRFAGRAMRPMNALDLGRFADTDRDGTVTQAEFATAALARFDRADADRNGTISRDERRQRRPRRADGPAS